jgi:hypothetical protein
MITLKLIFVVTILYIISSNIQIELNVVIIIMIHHLHVVFRIIAIVVITVNMKFIIIF